MRVRSKKTGLPRNHCLGIDTGRNTEGGTVVGYDCQSLKSVGTKVLAGFQRQGMAVERLGVNVSRVDFCCASLRIFLSVYGLRVLCLVGLGVSPC
ncbi:unnamed protein product [Ectocarpus sp. 6 AP-2014]